MKKSMLCKLEMLKFPRKVDVTLFKAGTKYLYTAKQDNIANLEHLVIDFYCLLTKTTQFRVFLTNGDFVSWLGAKSKWSDSMLAPLIPIAVCAPADNLAGAVINGFIRDRLSAEMASDPLLNVDKYQLEIRNRELKAKHDIVKKRVDGRFACIEMLPDDINEWIERIPLKEHQYIFYKKNGKQIHGLCSACQNNVSLNWAKHNEQGVCPVCGHAVSFKSEGISKNTSDKFFFAVFQKGIKSGEIICRLFDGCKAYHDCPSYKWPKVDYMEYARLVFNSSDTSCDPYYFGNFKQTGERRWCEGVLSYTICSRHSIVCYREAYLYSANLRNVLLNTKWIDSGLDLYAARGVALDIRSYFAVFNKLNGVRHLVYNKLFSLVDDMLWNSTAVDEEIFALIRESKSYYEVFRDVGITVNEIRLIKVCGKMIRKDLLLQLREFGVDGSNVDMLIEVLKYACLEKAVNYIGKIISAPPEIYVGVEQIIQMPKRTVTPILIEWRDYLDISSKLGYDMCSSFVIYPKKLKEAHDRASGEYRLKQAKICNEKIKNMALTLNKALEYSDGMFFIRAPHDAAEILHEGTELVHCVSRYISDMAEQKTVILFLRVNSEPKEPFYTVEYKNGKVTQCRGYHNTPASSEVNDFLDKWQKSVANKVESLMIGA